MNDQGCAEARETQVDQEKTNMGSNLERLRTKVSALQGRLDSILRQEPSKLSGEGCDRVSLVGLASEIRGFSEIVQTETEKIDDILDRLEL